MKTRIEEVSQTQNVGVYLFLVVCTGGNYLLSLADLGGWKLPLLLAVAVVEMTVGAFFYMHLIEQTGSMRFIPVVSLVWVALLIGVVMLEVITRYPPTNAPGPRYQQLPPERPARVRVFQQGGNTPPRMSGF